MNLKYLTILLIFMFCSSINEVAAQSYTYVDNSVPVSTQSNNGRYEFIQSTNDSSHAFLLDKFSGCVWRYRIGKKRFEELKREQPDSVIADRINYQMYISAENYSMCFLLNVHTGEMWRYASNEGEKTFTKMIMPWDIKDNK
ncbi:MAG: hypothetical protein IJA57_07950 [Alistipes sp.]|nr:hypothetical protein [Alistipes sp.]